MLERVWRKENSPRLLVGMWIGTATMENNMDMPQKTKNRVAIWSSSSIPGHIPRKSTIWKDICTSMFIAAIFSIAKKWKQPKCPSTDEWMKMWHTQTHTHAHTRTHTHTHIHTHPYTHTRAHTPIYTHTHTYAHTHTPIYTHTHTPIYTHTYTHTHIDTCAHTHTHMHDEILLSHKK